MQLRTIRLLSLPKFKMNKDLPKILTSIKYRLKKSQENELINDELKIGLYL